MSNTAKKLLISAAGFTIIVVLIVIMSGSKKDDTTPDNTRQVSTQEISAKLKTKPETITIANKWQWQEPDNQTDETNIIKNTDSQLPFTTQSVYNALQAVKVDENGDVILDHDALLSLDEALERIYNKLDGDSLQQLRELIEEALPGKVGEQTAKLVGDYNGFLKAKDEFSQVYEGAAVPSAEQSTASIDSDQALYEELKALRGIHLGDAVADKLFEVSNANAKFMFESMKLEMDTTLTSEQKAQRRQEIQAELEAVIPSDEPE